jgi:hypothetical protein
MNINRLLKEVQFAQKANRKQLEQVIRNHIEYCGNEEASMDIMRIIKLGRNEYAYYFTC